MATHIAKIFIKNNLHKIISITCTANNEKAKVSKSPYINEDKNTLSLLPGEGTTYSTNNFNINENCKFTLTIMEAFPGNTCLFTRELCFSNYTDVTAKITMHYSTQNGKTVEAIDYAEDGNDYTGDLIRYMGFEAGKWYAARFYLCYKEKTSDSWTEKKIDYFNIYKGTNNCSNQSDYPNGAYDLKKAGLKEGYYVTAKVDAVGGTGKATSKAVFRYHPNYSRVAKYKCSGGSCSAKINNPSAEDI